MNRHFKLLILVATLTIGILGAVLLVHSFARAESPALTNATITVNSLQDELNNDGDCSLREAIEAANTDTATDACPAGSGVAMDAIRFGVSGNIQLTAQLEVLGGGGPLTIDGQRNISILGGSGIRVFYVYAGADLILDGLTLTKGDYMQGAGIYNFGTLVVSNSVLSDNIFIGVGTGAGIYNNGNLNIINSIFSNNYILGRGSGGCILNNGTLTVLKSTFSNNWTDGSGGCIENLGLLTITDSTMTGNRASRFGGAIDNFGTMTMTQSTLTGNWAKEGGAIFAGEDSTVVINSTIHGNNAGNHGGGIYSQALVVIANSTLSGNSAVHSGGGVYGGGFTLKNTIVANNTSTDTDWGGPDCYTPWLASEGYNLIGNTADCNFVPATGDLTNIDPALGPLQDNGGATNSCALLFGSPAIDAGNPAGCTDPTGNPLNSDQRGEARYGRCDIGSFELQALELSTKTASPDTVSRGDPITYTIELKNGGSISIAHILVTDTLPGSLAYIGDSLTATSGSYGLTNGVITWTGSVNASDVETITFGAIANPSALGTAITNSVVIIGAGEILTRTTIVNIPPAKIFVPQIAKNFCRFFDDFSDPGSGWYVGEDSEGRFEYLNGDYRVLVKPADFYWLLGAPTTCDLVNYMVEADAYWAGNTGASYGLIFGIQGDFERFYSFEVNADDKEFSLYRYDAAGWTELVPPTVSSAIYPGAEENHLKVVRNGDAITLGVSGSILGTWSDGAITGASGTGLIVSSYSNLANADAGFDNFRITGVGSTLVAAAANDDGEVQQPLQHKSVYRQGSRR